MSEACLVSNVSVSAMKRSAVCRVAVLVEQPKAEDALLVHPPELGQQTDVAPGDADARARAKREII